MNKNVIVFIIVSLVFSACYNDERNVFVRGDEQQYKITLDENLVPKKDVSYLLGNYGNYTLFLERSDYLVGLSSSKPSPIEPAFYSGYVGASEPTETRNSLVGDIQIRIDGMLYAPDKETKSGLALPGDIFGKQHKIVIENSCATKGDGEGEESLGVNLYVPEEITLISPLIETSDDFYPLCYYDGFQLRWNEDVDNSNGIIVLIDWVGETVLGGDLPNTHVRRFCTLPDTGTAILDAALFDGIPDTAVCHMTLLRGNLAMIDVNDITCKVLFESHEFFTFVLIRELK